MVSWGTITSQSGQHWAKWFSVKLFPVFPISHDVNYAKFSTLLANKMGNSHFDKVKLEEIFSELPFNLGKI